MNKSSVLQDAEIQAWLPGLNKFMADVRYYWPRPANLIWCPNEKEPALAWKVIFADTTDQAGALAYHDFTPDGRPISYVFAKTLLDGGYSVTVGACHEIAEMLADPFCACAEQMTNSTFYAREICDPVEDDSEGYIIRTPGFPDVLASNFVTPRYFIPGTPDLYKLDKQGNIDTPGAVNPGGYMYVFVSGRGWKPIYSDKETGEVKRASLHDLKGKSVWGRMVKYGRELDSELPEEVRDAVYS